MLPDVPRKKLSSVKAARKQPVRGSVSDDGPGYRSANKYDEDSNSDHSTEGLSSSDARPPLRATKRVSSKKKEVKFDLQEDPDSDDSVAVRAPPSHHRGSAPVQQQRVVQRSPSPPPVQRKQINSRLRGSTPQELALAQARERPSRSYGDLEDPILVRAKPWRSKRTGKAHVDIERRYARMSIGSGAGGRSGPSQSSRNSTGERRLQGWYLHRGRVVTRGKGTSNRQGESETDGDDEDVQPELPPRPRNQSATKSKPMGNPSQFGRKSRPQKPRKSDEEVDDNVSNVSHTDDLVDEIPAASTPVIATSEDDDEDVHHPTKPSQALLNALERFSLNVARLHKKRRLPFLCRNLRRGFQLSCERAGVDTKPVALPRVSTSVLYSSRPSEDSNHPGRIRTRTEIAKGSMKDWMCPLCDLHKTFSNQAVLDKHLAWDHPGIDVSWDQHHTRLSLTIADSQSESNPVRVHQDLVRGLSASEFPSRSRQVERNESVDSEQRSLARVSTTPFGAASEASSGSITTIPTSVDEDRQYLKFKEDTPFSSAVDTSTRMGSLSSHSVSRGFSSDLQDGLGPSATSPYLPEMDESGAVYYSCRPGGPRLYDFMNTLSLQPYGVLKWVIIDREEELFELDDILDEDKVMQALWYRWIFLNRNKFVANYFDGTKVFIEANWELIKQGAGLLALRTWLLVLLVNNFLLPAEVATLIRRYQELANIQLQ